VAEPLRWHRIDRATCAIGRRELTTDGDVPIGLDGPERCIVDALRLRNPQGEELAIEALRRWPR
jgi:hypothetical protein